MSNEIKPPAITGNQMRYKIFGRHTGLSVSKFSLGTGMFGTKWGYGSEREESRRIFDAYAEAGGNFIDTAAVSLGFWHEFLATLQMRQLLAGKKLELIDFPMVPVG